MPAGFGVFDIPLAGRLVSGGRTVDTTVVKRAMALCCDPIADHLFCDDVVPCPCHQFEPVAGKGAVGLVLETGSDKEDDRSGNFVRHATLRVGGDVRGANRVIGALPCNQHPLHGHADPCRLWTADA